MVVVVQKRGIGLGDLEVESLGNLTWFESALLNPLDDSQHWNAPPFDVGFPRTSYVTRDSCCDIYVTLLRERV
jgi:hypothetical protein